jgi:outer membrane protein assembly factor BamD
MKKGFSIFFVLILFLSSCSEYQKLLKSTDPELKYNKAVEYFDKGDFVRAATLFDDISVYYRGTDRSEEILNYLAQAYIGQKDYYSAINYFQTYVKSYPKGKYTEDAKFMIGYCYYKDSPDARLDQTATNQAINAFQEFLDLYPESKLVPDANRMVDELLNKLAYKYFLNARLYFNLGNYMGNNYLSAVITAQNALKKFPSTSYRDDLSFLILQSKFAQAEQSIVSKREERYQDTIDEYYSYINEFQDGKYRKQADKIFNDSKKAINIK